LLCLVHGVTFLLKEGHVLVILDRAILEDLGEGCGLRIWKFIKVFC